MSLKPPSPSSTSPESTAPEAALLHRVTLLPSRRVLEVHTETRLFDACRRAGVPLASTCDGDAICARCKVEVLSGAEQLSPVTPAEARLLARVKADPHERMACEVQVRGDVTLTTGYW